MSVQHIDTYGRAGKQGNAIGVDSNGADGFQVMDRQPVLDSHGKGLPVAMELLNARSEWHQVFYFHKTILGMEWLPGTS